jgi:hypothetical protein
MQFLKIAAAGDWVKAAATATAVDMPRRQWDEWSLRAFVDSLAPGDQRDAQHIAAELADDPQVGQLTAERCASALAEWPWLVQRAQGEWAQATETAKQYLNWPECTIEWLDYLLCQIAQRTDGDGWPAATAIYRRVLFGTFTHQDLAKWAAPAQLHTAVTETDDALHEAEAHTAYTVSGDGAPGSSTRQRASSGSAAPGEPDSSMSRKDTDLYAPQMDDLLQEESWIGARDSRVQEHTSQQALKNAQIRDAYVDRIAPDPSRTRPSVQESAGKNSSPSETIEEKLRILRQQNDIKNHNKEVLKGLDEHSLVKLSIITAGSESNVVLGDKFQKYYESKQGVTIVDARLRMVRKGGLRGAGKVEVTGIYEAGHKALVKRELKEVSDKKVDFPKAPITFNID